KGSGARRWIGIWPRQWTWPGATSFSTCKAVRGNVGPIGKLRPCGAECEEKGKNMLILADENTWSPVAVGITIFVLIVLLVIFGLLFQFLGLYIRALVSGARVGLLDLIGM